ncbi:MAG: hypothetical protein EAZ91_18855 [Cytophagales bacterium]|nr:MAG: hypothetical protein EAZ91_18855 [Cytophagales bacterium]
MRLLSLHLFTPFRGLPADFHVEFRPPTAPNYEQLEPVCFVGLNGSGKSNVLQVLGEIFACLEARNLMQRDYGFRRWAGDDVFWNTVAFELSYTLDTLTWGLAQSENDKLPAYDHVEADYPVIKIQKRPDEPVRWDVLYKSIPFFNQLGFGPQIPGNDYPPLPRHIVGYSSGMNELISNAFIRSEVQCAEQFFLRRDTFDTDLDIPFDGPDVSEYFPYDLEDESSDSELASTTTSRNRLLYLDYESNKLITLANFLVRDDKRLGLLYDLARIENVRSFSVTINYPYYPSYADEIPPELIELPGGLNQTINRLTYCATTWTGDPPEDKDRKQLRLDFWVNDATKDAFNHHFKTAENLLNELYGLRLLNVLDYSEELRQRIKTSSADENLSVLLPRPEPQKAAFHVGNLKLVKSGTNGQLIPYRNLSDGEHQLLHVFGALMLMDQPGTLFLFDEPETHFNPDWRSRFVKLLNDIVQDPEPDADGQIRKRQQEVLLTSHSPFIVSDCKPENVFVFERNSDGTVAYRKPDFNTFGASINQITLKVFGKRETISEMAMSQLKGLERQVRAGEKTPDEARNLTDELGDSVEKMLFLKFVDQFDSSNQ